MFQNTWLETEASIIVPVCLIILLASRILPNLLIKQDPTDKWSHVLDAQAWSEAGNYHRAQIGSYLTMTFLILLVFHFF